jgi:ubiquinone/menaquinone biosynthesis C-methylase UbiE
MTENTGQSSPGGGEICRAEHAGWLIIPGRRLIHNPEKILRGLIKQGQTVVDLGCGPGFFTLPMAKLVGESGCVIAVDLQQEMLEKLRQRVEKEGLLSRIHMHKSETDKIRLTEQADFVLAFYMVHEVPDVASFISEVYSFMKPGAQFLLVEPKFHVSTSDFNKTIDIACSIGMKPVSKPRVMFSRSMLFKRE